MSIQTDHFARAIALEKWLIFKIVSLLEYLIFFFEKVVAQNYFHVIVELISASFFGILNVDPNRPFCKGYSPCNWPSLKIV